MTDALIARLEAATEDQQKELLTEAVYAAVHNGWLTPEAAERAFRFIEVGAFLDAALTLVPEGWATVLEIADCEAWAYLTDRDRQHPKCKHTEGYAFNAAGKAIPALALCIAARKASAGKDTT